MVRGVVVLNGRPVPQRLVGLERAQFGGSAIDVRRLAERFPGERRDHHIYDSGLTAGDNFVETTVPPGHVFLLGDNRDNSADSRFPDETFGLGFVPTADVVGRPVFFSWGPGMANAGEAIGD